MSKRGITALVASAAVVAATLVAAPSAASAAQPPRPIVSGWFGWWASDTSIAAMTSTADGVVGEVAMFWWSFQGAKNPLCLYDNGDYDADDNWGDPLCKSATPWTTPKFDRQRKTLQAAGIKINASITDLSSASKGQLSAYLSKAKNRRAYAKLITESAVKAGVDGIDLDWEVFAFHDDRAGWAQTRDSWVKMIKLLSKSLHTEGLTLWATVPGGSSTSSDSTGYWVYAWSEIAPYVDRLNIMAYDYSYSVPGPIGPNNWARLVSQSAVQQVGVANAGKVWIGAPQYGRDWPVQSGTGWVVNDKCPSGWAPSVSPTRGTLTVLQAYALAEREDVKPTWNPTQGEWSFDYWVPTAGKVEEKGRNCKVKRSVWFADTESALQRASIVPDQRIGGIAVWEFRDLQADFYSKLADYGRKIAPAPTTVSVKAPKSAKHGRLIPIRVETQSRAGVADGAEATLHFIGSGASDVRTQMATMTLGSDGKGVFRVPAQASGSWVVSVAGSWSRMPSESTPVSTAVRLSVTAQASATTIASGTPVTITGVVSPAAQGLAVAVQRRSAQGEWREVSSVTTGVDGTFTASVKPTIKGEAIYRLLTPAAQGLEAGVSVRIVLTVK